MGEMKFEPVAVDVFGPEYVEYYYNYPLDSPGMPNVLHGYGRTKSEAVRMVLIRAMLLGVRFSDRQLALEGLDPSDRIVSPITIPLNEIEWAYPPSVDGPENKVYIARLQWKERVPSAYEARQPSPKQ